MIVSSYCGWCPQAFAALVKLGTVSISGSITTIITLLNKAENRCAAVTMLGKTCELCGELLVEKVGQQRIKLFASCAFLPGCMGVKRLTSVM